MIQVQFFERPVAVTVAPGYSVALRRADLRPAGPTGEGIEPTRIDARAVLRVPIATSENSALPPLVEAVVSIPVPKATPELIAVYVPPFRVQSAFPTPAATRLDDGVTTLVASRINASASFVPPVAAAQSVELRPALQTATSSVFKPTAKVDSVSLAPPKLTMTTSVMKPTAGFVKADGELDTTDPEGTGLYMLLFQDL